MNRFISANSLLAALALPFVWVAILFVFKIQAHRSTVKKELLANELNLKCLTFSAKEFDMLEWEHKKEFRWQGVMYDVKEITKTDDVIQILAFEDIPETEIIRYFRKCIKKIFGKGENSREQSQLVNLWIKSLFLPPDTLVVCNQSDELLILPLPAYLSIHSGAYHGEAFHPPCS